MIRLASDIESLPNAAMRAAMVAAEVGDEQKGDDSTVNPLVEGVSVLPDAGLQLDGIAGAAWRFDAATLAARVAETRLAPLNHAPP